jgi:hypothetical protein
MTLPPAETLQTERAEPLSAGCLFTLAAALLAVAILAMLGAATVMAGLADHIERMDHE